MTEGWKGEEATLVALDVKKDGCRANLRVAREGERGREERLRVEGENGKGVSETRQWLEGEEGP